MNTFGEYLASEMSARKNTRPHNIMMSRTDHSALMRLYKCAGKGWAYLEGLIVSGDEDLVQSVQYFMKALEITDSESLSAWAAKTERYADILIRRQRDGRNGISDDEFSLMKKLQETEEDDKPTRVLLLMVMCLFAEGCSEEFTPKPALKEYLEIMNPHKVIGLYKMLFHTITAYRKRDRKSSSQKQNPEATVQEDTPQASYAQDDNTAKLLEQIDDLKSELEGAYIRLNASEENYSALQEEGHEAAVNEVLELLNSQESGMLLDQFAKAENTLRQLTAKKIEIPEDLSSLSLCVKIFMRTMRNVFGISPVLKAGEVLEITLDQAKRYIYSGSQFADDDETKKVEVTSPGWKRGDEIFSQPKVIEYRKH